MEKRGRSGTGRVKNERHDPDLPPILAPFYQEQANGIGALVMVLFIGEEEGVGGNGPESAQCGNL